MTAHRLVESSSAPPSPTCLSSLQSSNKAQTTKERPPRLPNVGVDPTHSDLDEAVNQEKEGG
jgi:hypothetical protein